MTRAGQLNEFTDYDVKFQIQKEVDFFDINVVQGGSNLKVPNTGW